MLGQDLMAYLAARYQVLPLTRNDADITDASVIARAIDSRKPSIVVHAAAFTAVDECERQPERAFRVNAEGTLNVARACRNARLPLLYVSTDYVFDGEKTEPYLENDVPNPINVYGRSKLQGEKHVSELVTRFWIVRTSWLFGPLRKNFVRTILEKVQRGESLRVVDDQVGAPTYTTDLAAALGQILEKGSPGIYHGTNQGYCSWFEFAQEIIRQAGLNQVRIAPIRSSESDRPARRPRNSRLANKRLEAEGLPLLPLWQDALRRYILRQTEMRG